MHVVNEESCANDGEHTEGKLSRVQAITLTSSCLLPHGLPFSSLESFVESTA